MNPNTQAFKRFKKQHFAVQRLYLTDSAGAFQGYIENNGGEIKLVNASGTAVTLSAAELALIDGLTAGTVTASKALVVDANKDIATLRHVTLSGNLVTGVTTLSETDLAKIDAITNGTVAAGKAAVPDANLDIGDFRNLDAVNFDAGASGTAGSLDIFPATAAKGKTVFTSGEITGNGTCAITTAAQAASRIYTIPDGGANATFPLLVGGAVSAIGAATSVLKLMGKKTAIADAAATDIITVTVPNANHACCIKLRLLSSNGAGDAFESSRCAEGLVVVARTTGANAVAAAAALALAQIATVAAGATHTLAYGVSAIAGAVGDPNTFTIQVTIDDLGNVGGNQLVWIAELINAEASGVTMAAA